MTENDFDSFSAVVVGFAELKGKQLSAAAIRLYWGAMQNWNLQDFTAAAEQLLLTSEFMPTPKEFEDLRKAGRPTTGEAWIAARAAMRDASWSDIEASGFTCGNALIDRAVRAIGGYGAIGMCETDKLHFLERRFAEHYQDLEGVEDVRRVLPQLTGAEPAVRVTGPQRAISTLVRRA
jgi:hypothetical protein